MKSIRNDSVCRPAALVTAILSCAVAYATVRTNTLVNGASNWNDPNSYTDTSFVPGNHEDVVVILDNAIVYLNSSDTASFNIMSNLSYLCFTYTNSVLEITVPEGGDVLFDCKFKATLDEQEPFIADVKDRCFPGIGIRCGFGDIDPETAAAQIREIRSRGYKGFAVFAYTAYTMDVLRQLKKEGLL